MSEVTMQTAREQWLEDRKQQIGASELAAILGVSPFASGWEIWAEKKGMLEPWAGNEQTKLGNHFERAVLDYAEDKLGTLKRNVRIVHESLPLAATLDAQAMDLRPVEAKTTGLYGRVFGDWGDERTDEIPEYYLCQVHCQIMCSKADLGYMFALIAGQGVMEFHVPRNDALYERMGNIVSDWWERHIVQGEEPSREKVPLDVVKRMRRVPAKQVYFGADEQLRIEELDEMKAEAKTLKDNIDACQTSLLLSLGDAESAICADGRELTYFEQKRASYVVNESKFRVMRFRKNKD